MLNSYMYVCVYKPKYLGGNKLDFGGCWQQSLFLKSCMSGAFTPQARENRKYLSVHLAILVLCLGDLGPGSDIQDFCLVHDHTNCPVWLLTCIKQHTPSPHAVHAAYGRRANFQGHFPWSFTPMVLYEATHFLM